jgi:hypothetical protein
VVDRHVHGYVDHARLGNAARKLKENAQVLATKER